MKLRYVEDEIHKKEHDVFQAEVKLGVSHMAVDGLGLKDGRRDEIPWGKREERRWG